MKQYNGLWATDNQGWYSSNVVEIKGKSKILMRYNKYYEKNSNKPKFIFDIVPANCDVNKQIEESKDAKEVLDQIINIMLNGVKMPRINDGSWPECYADGLAATWIKIATVLEKNGYVD